jgi:hypothetical protein
VVRRGVALAVTAIVSTLSLSFPSPVAAQDPAVDPAVPVVDPAPLPPEGDGSEIADPVPLPAPAPAPRPAGRPGAAPVAPRGPARLPDLAGVRAEVEARVAAAGDALAVAREVEAAAAAGLAEADARLVEGQAQLAAALDRRDQAAQSAADASAEAGTAAEQAGRARGELRAAAVDMFINPPAATEVAAALQGEVAARMAARGLVAARTEVLRRSESSARRSANAAIGKERAAAAAARSAAEAAASAEAAQADVAAQVAERRAAADEARAKVQTLEAELGGLFVMSGALISRLSIEALSGVVPLDIIPGADGSFSVVGGGLPTAADTVRVPGTTISVHRLIAEPVAAMIADAAAAGIRLDGWGYRDTNRQIQLRRSHCGPSYEAVFHAPSASCSPPTARPGRSMHERGLAVDFANCSSRSTACYQWLAVNAARYGLFNLPSEPWHWSTNGN